MELDSRDRLLLKNKFCVWPPDCQEGMKRRDLRDQEPQMFSPL